MLRLFCEEGRKTRQDRSGNRWPLLSRHIDGAAETMPAECAGIDAGRVAAAASVGDSARFHAIADAAAVCGGQEGMVRHGPALHVAFRGERIRRKEQIKPTIEQSGAAAQSAHRAAMRVCRILFRALRALDAGALPASVFSSSAGIVRIRLAA